MERLGSPQHGSERLYRYPDHIVERLLGLKRDATGLSVEPHSGCGISGLETLSYDTSPQPTSGPKFCRLLEQIVVAGKKERQSRAELINAQSGLPANADVFQRVGQGKANLLDRCRAGLPHVVPADGDRIEAHALRGNEAHDVRHEPEGGTGRIDVG